jgi:hypothetical protein
VLENMNARNANAIEIVRQHHVANDAKNVTIITHLVLRIITPTITQKVAEIKITKLLVIITEVEVVEVVAEDHVVVDPQLAVM